MKLFNSFQLKIIMIIIMFVDHVGQFIPGSPLWLHYIGRVAAPYFITLVEDFHTSSKKYMERLFISGAMMFWFRDINTYI